MPSSELICLFDLPICRFRAISRWTENNEIVHRPVTKTVTSEPIDVVITWVDGNDPAHRARRAHYMEQSGQRLNENASNPHRWEQSDEIYYCLQSIHNHAPWVRRIWIVVEAEGPDLTRLPQTLRNKISIALHADIFAGYTDVLPTFNSLAIESMMWRIEGLAERFLYFNDDVFLTSALLPADVFVSGSPVLRGDWVNYSALLDDPVARTDPALFAEFMHINGAVLCGYQAAHLFACAHVVHPLRRSVMAALFDRHKEAFLANIRHRFRDLSQFLPQGAHTHTCLRSGEFMQGDVEDHLHITSGQGAGQPPEKTRALLSPEGLAGVKFLCVNDLPQLEVLAPDARELIAQAVGGMPEPL